MNKIHIDSKSRLIEAANATVWGSEVRLDGEPIGYVIKMQRSRKWAFYPVGGQPQVDGLLITKAQWRLTLQAIAPRFHRGSGRLDWEVA